MSESAAAFIIERVQSWRAVLRRATVWRTALATLSAFAPDCRKIATPMLGLPSTVAVYSWAADLLKK